MAVQVFAEPTERDKQRLVGASNFSNPCNKCLAEDMLGIEREQSDAWLGGVIGTAVHALAEERLNTSESLRELFGQPEVEVRLDLGEIEGYGRIKSTSDLYLPKDKICWDWKTSTPEKLKKYTEVIEYDLQPDPQHFSTLRYEDLMNYVFTVKMYINQLHAYARGLVQSGKEVTHVAIAFVVRGGSRPEDAIKVFKFDYDPELADKVWNRVNLMWEFLTEGYTPDNFDGHPNCWYCRNKR